jgi:hypothetical protein
MRITLLPSETELRLTTRVVASEPLDGAGDADCGPFWLRAEFASRDVIVQEMLISHIVQRQQLLIGS